MRPGDRHLLMSVTKVFTSAVTGILELRGELDLRSPWTPSSASWPARAGRESRSLTCSGWPRASAAWRSTAGRAIPILRTLSTGSRRAWAGGRPAAARCRRPMSGRRALPSHRRPGRPTSTPASTPSCCSWLSERVTGRAFGEVLGREIWSRAGFEAAAPAVHLPRPARRAATAGCPRRCGTWRGSGCCSRPAAASSPTRRSSAPSSAADPDRSPPRVHQDSAAALPGYMTAAYGPRAAARQPAVELRDRGRRPVQGRLRGPGTLCLPRPRSGHRVRRDAACGWFGQPAALVQPPPRPLDPVAPRFRRRPAGAVCPYRRSLRALRFQTR